MKLIIFITLFSTASAIIRIIYKKKFLLSILIALELILLNLIILKVLASYKFKYGLNLSFSLFLLTLSAIEARIGISILSLITRKFRTNNISSVKLLKK